MELDAEYARLRRQGFLGWGGPDAERRVAGWKKLLHRLEKDGWLPQPPASLLELGCGNGIVSFLTAEEGYAVSGIDLSQVAIEWARERCAQAGVSGDFHCGDVRAMPFGEESFEVVIDGNCFHCLFGSDRSQCLQEVRRVLKRGGTFILSSMCGDLKLDRFMPRYSESGRCLMRDGRPYRTLKPPHEIEGELAVAGFRVLHREVAINPWWDHLTIVATI